MRPWVESRAEDLVLLQETRVTKNALNIAQSQAADAGWAGVWQESIPNVSGPSSGGLAILCKAPGRIQKVPHECKHAPRWLHCVAEHRPGHPIHVITLYGYDSGQPQAARRNAELFREVFEHVAELGRASWIIGGDWNVPAEEVWELVAAEGRGLFLPRGPPDPEAWTCKMGHTRIDFFVAGAALHGK